MSSRVRPGASTTGAPDWAVLASGGTCEGPTSLLPGRTYLGTTEDASEEQEGSCGNTSGRERVYRLDVPNRQRVTIDVAAQFDSVLYLRKDECGDDSNEVDCNDDAAGNAKRSKIDRVLDPGVYYAVVDGTEEGGSSIDSR